MRWAQRYVSKTPIEGGFRWTDPHRLNRCRTRWTFHLVRRCAHPCTAISKNHHHQRWGPPRSAPPPGRTGPRAPIRRASPVPTRPRPRPGEWRRGQPHQIDDGPAVGVDRRVVWSTRSAPPPSDTGCRPSDAVQWPHWGGGDRSQGASRLGAGAAGRWRGLQADDDC